MVTLDLSLISFSPSPDAVTQALTTFEAQSGIRVNVHFQNWATAWAELVKAAIYKSGYDVSEVGSTWVGDLMEMNVLRPFTAPEIDSLGGQKAFLESGWQSCSVGNRAWAVPWLVDSRFLYYRRDMLQKAGIDEAVAFESAASLKETLQCLKESGAAFPWAIPTHKTRMTLHNVASWVWGAGGHFLSEDGRQVRFDAPEALEGICQYFGLARYLAPTARELDDIQSDALFGSGQAAATISGPWLLREWVSNPEVRANAGVAFPPGVPFVGGSNLVAWQHSPYPRETLALIRFLTGALFQGHHVPQSSLLPSRLEALNDPKGYARDPMYAYLSRGLQIGRSFRLIHMWGLVEDRLSTALSVIWAEILRQPHADPRQIIIQHLQTLASRLNMLLAGK